MVVVRTRNRAPLVRALVSARSREVLHSFERHASFPEHGVEVLRLRPVPGAPRMVDRDAARELLRRDPAVEFAGCALVSASGMRHPNAALAEPVVYTENLFVAFREGTPRARARALLQEHGLRVRRTLPWAGHAYAVSAPRGTGVAVFAIAGALLERPEVELCHPELVRRRLFRRAFAPQWHLRSARVNGVRIDAHVDAAGAWRAARGEGVTIAVIDEGIDIDHEEFARRGKIVSPRDVTHGHDDPRPGRGEAHGTACAGIACAEGRAGASGVAPAARLMPIRMASGIGSFDEATALAWAVEHGADVISCSWGPPDGQWWNPDDPTHDEEVPLPDYTRLAIEYAAARGRKGRGAVVCFAAGNGNEPVDHDGYASHPHVIAVAACNDRSTRSVYSDYGAAVWCAFPSNDYSSDALGHPPPRTPGIWTTDVTGNAGYNPGGALTRGDREGDYTSGFGGTSSACPGVAGVAALVLARNPRLRARDVREVIRRCCDRIDEAGGEYDEDGHSRYYGYGRVNARRAVSIAARFVLVFALAMSGGCAATAEYGELGKAGAAYAAAVEKLLVADAELHADASSERLLQNDALANLTEAQYERATDDDRRLIATLWVLRRHVRLTREYFVRLGEVAGDRTASKVDDTTAALAGQLRDLGERLEESPLLDADGRKALGALAAVGVSSALRGALARELRAHGDAIRRELALQRALLDALAAHLGASLSAVTQAREHRLVRVPLMAEKPISNADRWVAQRRAVLLADGAVAELAAASEAAAALESAFEALMEGRLTADRLSALGIELQALLDVASIALEEDER